MRNNGLPQEMTHDPLVPSEKSSDGERVSRSYQPEPGERAHREMPATGEHPTLRTSSPDETPLVVARSSYEHLSAPSHEHEPEDQLPDHLDKYR